jgi:hypothetical protein
MTHNEGWHFLEIGRRLERASSTASLLRSMLVPIAGEQDENMVIEAVLGVTDSLITYRRRYRAGTRIGALLDLVFQDEGNPRALAYQLVQARTPGLGACRAASWRSGARRSKSWCSGLTGIRLAEIDTLVQPDKAGHRRAAGRHAGRSLDRQSSPPSPTPSPAQYFRHEEQPHSLLRRSRDAGRLMRFRINHVTRYEYAEPVSLCHSIAHLKPPQTSRQRCLSSQIRVDPWPAVHREHEDFFGNRVSYFSIQQAHEALEVTAQSEVEVVAPTLPDPSRPSPGSASSIVCTIVTTSP